MKVKHLTCESPRVFLFVIVRVFIRKTKGLFFHVISAILGLVKRLGKADFDEMKIERFSS